MLCASGEAGYAHEPFNPNRSPGWFPEPLPYWFMYITSENEEPYLASVRRMIDLRYPTIDSLRRARATRIVAMNLQQSMTALRDRTKGKRLLLKDPLALFSAQWLYERFGMRPVILVRHPASFVSSIKRLNWGFDYERNWLAQPLLMRDLLPDYRSALAGYRGEVDLVGEGIVVWRAIYEVVSHYKECHPDWTILRYEDLAAGPVPTFRRLYDELGLTWSDEVERTVARHSSRDNPDEVPANRKHEIKRDSRAASLTWRTRLTGDEIRRIRDGTEPVWPRFYSERDWDLTPPAAPP